MEGCEYSSSEQDSSSIFSQLGSHSQETASQLPGSTVTEKSGQIMALGSPHRASQVPSGQVIRPSAFKASMPTPESQQTAQQPTSFQVAPHCILHNSVSDLESTDLVLGQAETLLRKEERLVDKCKVIRRKRPRAVSEDVEVHDVDGHVEKQSIARWKDAWVIQLIHIRGRMHKVFSSPQKQRVDLWQAVKNEMAKTCCEFDKDSEACRKKWRRVFKDYKDDRHAILSGNEKSKKCRFYDLIDSYMRDRVNGICNPPVIAEDRDIPLIKESLMTVREAAIPLVNEDIEVKVKGGTSLLHSSLKPHLMGNAVPNSIHSMLSELVNIGKEMLQTTREIEEAKLAVLHSLKDTLNEIAKKI